MDEEKNRIVRDEEVCRRVAVSVSYVIRYVLYLN